MARLAPELRDGPIHLVARRRHGRQGWPDRFMLLESPLVADTDHPTMALILEIKWNGAVNRPFTDKFDRPFLHFDFQCHLISFSYSRAHFDTAQVV